MIKEKDLKVYKQVKPSYSSEGLSKRGKIGIVRVFPFGECSKLINIGIKIFFKYVNFTKIKSSMNCIDINSLEAIQGFGVLRFGLVGRVKF